MRIYLFLLLITFLLWDCKKKEDTNPASLTSQNSNNTSVETVDSIFYWHQIATYSMDVTGDSINDIQFRIISNVSPSGWDESTYQIIIKNSSISVHSVLERDTICKDSVSTSGNFSYYINNCYNVNTFYSIDSTIYSPAVNEIDLLNTSYNFYHADTLLIYYANSSTHSTSPTTTVNYSIKHGAFKGKDEGYIVLEDTITKKIKAIKINIKVPYFRVWKPIKSLN